MFISRTRMSALAAAALLAGVPLARAIEPGDSGVPSSVHPAPMIWQVRADEKGKADEHGKDEHDKGEHGEGEHGEGHEGHHEHEHEEPSDLTLQDFFSTGWGEKFEERHREGHAPRFNLFKSRQGFLERIVVGSYAYTDGADGGRVNEHELSAGLEWAIDRRFQIGVEPLYTWQRRRAVGDEPGRNTDGLRWDFSTRLQLIDTADRAYNFQARVITPSTRIEAAQTELAFTFAGFEDLTKTVGLERVGLYHHIEYAALIGPRGPDEDRRPTGLLRYDVSVAKTLVDPTVPLIGDFTVFLEAFGQTDLDGARSGRTAISFTPGIRFNPTGREEKAWWIQAGVEFPVTGPRPFNERVLLSLTRDF